MEDQNRPVNPYPDNNQPQPLNPLGASEQFPAQLPEQLPSKKRLTKRTMITIASVVAVLILSAGVFSLKVQADNAAQQYAQDMDAHFERIFGEDDVTKRVEIIQDAAVLQPVFLGSVLSADYKIASTQHEGTYSQILRDGAEITNLRVEHGYSIKEIIIAIQDALANSNNKINIDDNADTTDTNEGLNSIETTLLVMTEKADSLDNVASEVEGMKSVKDYDSRDALITALEEWAQAQRDIVGNYLDWIDAISGISQTSDVSIYESKIEKNIEDYSQASNVAVDALTAMVDQLEQESANSDVTQRQADLSETTTAFRTELQKLIN